MSEIYFFDTYAFLSIIEGRKSYIRYTNATAVTTIFNLAELNWVLKRENIKTADYITKKYQEFLTEVTVNDLCKAMDLRKKNRNLSIPDSIGYIIAKRLGIKFLTGDKEFKKYNNVEFIK